MRYRSVVLSIFAAMLLVVGGLASVRAQDATPAAPVEDALLADLFGLPDLQITLTDAGFEGVPAETAAGMYVVTFTNNTTAGELAAVDFVQLPEGRTTADVDLLAQLAGGPPPEGEDAGMASPEAGMDMASPVSGAPEGEDPFAWLYETYASGGPGAQGGQTVQGIVDLPAGNYAVFDDLFGGALSVALTVTGDAAASPAASPATGTIAADVTVTEIKTEGGFDFTVEGTLAAGPNLIQIFNDSDQPHFLELIAFAGPITDAQFEAFLNFDDTLGTPPPPELAGVQPIGTGGYAAFQSAGSTQYLAVNLQPGTYALTCFIPDPTQGGVPHAFLGMYEIVEVA